MLILLCVCLNTFLCDIDFKRSAQMLDWQRLGKQRAEAYQVLNVVMGLEQLAQTYDNPLPKDPYDYYGWIRCIGNCFNKDPKKDSYCYEGTDRKLRIGWRHHPVALMWLGYSDCLKEYIDVHVQEWISRGYKNNTIQHYGITGSKRPEWTTDEYFIHKHKCNLLYKEIDRKEERWYQDMPEFNTLSRCEYFWPYTPSKENPTTMYIDDSHRRYD